MPEEKNYSTECYCEHLYGHCSSQDCSVQISDIDCFDPNSIKHCKTRIALKRAGIGKDISSFIE